MDSEASNVSGLVVASDDKKYSGICQAVEDTKPWPAGLKINTEGLSVLGDLF